MAFGCKSMNIPRFHYPSYMRHSQATDMQRDILSEHWNEQWIDDRCVYLFFCYRAQFFFYSLLSFFSCVCLFFTEYIVVWLIYVLRCSVFLCWCKRKLSTACKLVWWNYRIACQQSKPMQRKRLNELQSFVSFIESAATKFEFYLNFNLFRLQYFYPAVRLESI